MARIIGYTFEGTFLDLSRMEKVLRRALNAKVITQFDFTKSMSAGFDFVWFNGKPGKALRAVRDEVRSLVQANPK